jgi:hypothetical protein
MNPTKVLFTEKASKTFFRSFKIDMREGQLSFCAKQFFFTVQSTMQV